MTLFGLCIARRGDDRIQKSVAELGPRTVGIGGTSAAVGSGVPTRSAGCLSGLFIFAVRFRFSLVFFALVLLTLVFLPFVFWPCDCPWVYSSHGRLTRFVLPLLRETEVPIHSILTGSRIVHIPDSLEMLDRRNC